MSWNRQLEANIMELLQYMLHEVNPYIHDYSILPMSLLVQKTREGRCDWC